MSQDNMPALLEAYAEARHKHGHHTYNAVTFAARDAVIVFAERQVREEREARQEAQRELEQMRERMARTGLELRQAVQVEREACAAICDEQVGDPFTEYEYGHNDAAEKCAFAIRARSGAQDEGRTG